MNIRLFYKLFGTYVVIGVLAVLIAGFFIERELRTGLTRWVESDMMAQAGIMLLMPDRDIARQAATLSERARARITLIDAQGRVLSDSDPHLIGVDNHLNRSEIQEARIRGKGTATRYSRTIKQESLYVALPRYDGPVLTGYLRLSRTLAEVSAAIERFRYGVLQVLLLVVVCAMVLAMIFSMRLAAPIWEMAEFTEKIRKGDLSGMVMVRSRDEIGQLAGNINEMVAVLREKIRLANEEKWKLRAAFAGMAEGVMVLDSRDRIESLNRGMTEVIGRDYADIVKKTPIEVMRNVELQDALNRFRRGEQPVHQEITLEAENPRILDVTISTVKSPPGQEPKIMMVFHDVTRLKKLEQMRADFVANATHEMKTPLTAIIGFVETLEQGGIGDKATEGKFLKTIGENARRLNGLVDDLFVLSSLELGETPLHPEGVALEDFVDKALTLIQTKAALKNITIVKEVRQELPLIRADRDKAVQILLNILDNAVKFTPEGGKVTIMAQAEEDGDVIVKIADNGPGIAKSEIPRLGERFYRVDKTRSRDLGGTGLGLSIVKHLMQAHGGSMDIESVLGYGTTVSLRFPVFRQTAG
jgi:two-component system phosphate regulon sensor histidine kinase PhoR